MLRNIFSGFCFNHLPDYKQFILKGHIFQNKIDSIMNTIQFQIKQVITL